MVLELVDVFSTPYKEDITDYLKAASYAIHNCSDNGFNNFIEQQLKQQRKQPNWKTADQIKCRMLYRHINKNMRKVIRLKLM